MLNWQTFGWLVKIREHILYRARYTELYSLYKDRSSTKDRVYQINVSI